MHVFSQLYFLQDANFQFNYASFFLGNFDTELKLGAAQILPLWNFAWIWQKI
jgi:hypothetical protein